MRARREPKLIGVFRAPTETGVWSSDLGSAWHQFSNMGNLSADNVIIGLLKGKVREQFSASFAQRKQDVHSGRTLWTALRR